MTGSGINQIYLDNTSQRANISFRPIKTLLQRAPADQLQLTTTTNYKQNGS
jgi:hypothetical protein